MVFIQRELLLQALKDYQDMIIDVDRRCRRIISRYKAHIACTKGCAGNCCRIHISVYPVEAVSVALALQTQPADMRQRIQQKARQTSTFGPCPLLADGACRLYAARAVICRTHGLPVSTVYRGHRSVGFCQKNFRHLSYIPTQDVIDLDQLNNRLAAINRRFLSQIEHRLPSAERFNLAEALLIAI
jgi:Fe-S-cluster containining protein